MERCRVMNFYRRRPFALIITLSMLIYLMGAFADGWVRLTLGGAIILLTFLSLILLRRRKDFRICGIPSTLFFSALSVVLLIALLITHAYYDRYENYYRALGDNAEAGRLSAEIISVENETSFSNVYKIKLYEIDGISVSATGFVYTENAPGMSPGDRISFDGEFCPLEDFYGYRDVSRASLLEKGCVFTCIMDGDVNLIGKKNSVFLILAKLRDSITAKIAVHLDRDSAALSTALLLGERNSLGRVYRDFTYTGTLHILALSGMHIVIIGGLLEKLMLRFKIKAPVRRAAVCIFMILYTAVTGFLLSVVRAVLMLLIANLMYLFKKDSDGITSLFIALFLIVLFNPPAIYDYGLQLSFFATLGVLLLTEVPIHERFHIFLEKHQKLGMFLYRKRKFFSSVFASFGASIFVIPLQWLYFGEMSLFTIPATLILSPILNLLLTLLLPYLAFCVIDLEIICKPFAAVIAVLCHLSAKIAEILAYFSPLISLRYPFVPIIIIGFVIAIAVMMIKNVRGWHKAIIPYTLAVALIVTGAEIYEALRIHTPAVSYAAVKSNDIFGVFSGGKSIIIDCTNGSSSAMYHAMDILADGYSTSVDTLLLTKLTSRHIPAVKALVSRRKVQKIFIPSSEVNPIGHLITELSATAEEYGSEIIIYNRNKGVSFTLGDITVSLPKAVKISRSDRPLSAVKFTVGNDSLAYIGMSSWESEYIRLWASESEHFIFGVNGPVFKGFDSSILPESVKYIFTAGEDIADNLSEGDVPINIGNRLDIVFK